MKQLTPTGSGTPAGLDLLVVEPDGDTAWSMAELLGLHGHRVVVAGTGEAAVRLAAEFAPDVVLLELTLPDVDGCEVARRVRAACGPRAPLLIAVTARGLERDVRQSMAAGVSLHLVKPADPRALVELLSRYHRVMG